MPAQVETFIISFVDNNLMVKLDDMMKKDTITKMADKDFLMETLTDETLGPHVHLAILLLIVIIVAVIIALIGL